MAVLDRIADRGSDGVILKAPDHPLVAAAVARLAERGIPVVTFVTDLPTSRRAAYVGVDNRAAGATAAYLVTSWARREGPVLVTLSSSSFHGEEEREAGFRAAMADLAPQWMVHEVTDTDGLDATMRAAVRGALEAEPGIAACYSIGGGNRAILDVFDELGRTPEVFVAHDLDADNRRLLRTRRISAVLHHDLRADMRRACRLLLQARGVLPGSPASVAVADPGGDAVQRAVDAAGRPRLTRYAGARCSRPARPRARPAPSPRRGRGARARPG